MDTATLTILFEDPFWVGLYQRRRAGTYQVCKITFGPEPRDNQVYDLLLRHWHELRFTPPLPDRTAAERRINPKRQQRAIHREVTPGLPGTKAQQALQAQREQGKAERTIQSRRQREREEQRRYALRQQKRKEKRRGH